MEILQYLFICLFSLTLMIGIIHRSVLTLPFRTNNNFLRENSPFGVSNSLNLTFDARKLTGIDIIKQFENHFSHDAEIRMLQTDSFKNYSNEVLYSMRGSFLKDSKNRYYRLVFHESNPLLYGLLELNTTTVSFHHQITNRLPDSSIKESDSILANFQLKINPFLSIQLIQSVFGVFDEKALSNVLEDSLNYLEIDVRDDNNNNLSPVKDTLIVCHTSNHLKITIITTDYLKNTFEKAHILIVDDASIDGTPDYLIKKGYSVLTKRLPRGQIDSWNIGYRIANAIGYKYVIFLTSFVLLTDATVQMLKEGLKQQALIAPLMSSNGALKEPLQSIVNAYNLNKAMEDYVSDFHNLEPIQKALQGKFGEQPQFINSTSSAVMDSCFAINLQYISVFAEDNPFTLFRTTAAESNMNKEGNINSPQNHLFQKIIQKNSNFLPKISRSAFVYHFVNQFSDSSVSTIAQAMSSSIGNITSPISYPTLYKFYQSLNTNLDYGLYPSPQDPTLSSKYSSASSNPSKDSYGRVQYQNKIVIAMATSDPIKKAAAGDVFTAEELAESLERNYNVLIKYLHKGVNWYSSKYLHDVDILITFVDDYDLSKLYQIPRRGSDKGEGELYHWPARRNGHLKGSVSSTIITIAWMRNWFQRWLSRPWIGNYDILLTSSHKSKMFYDIITNKVGLQVHCSISCPSLAFPSFVGKGSLSASNSNISFANTQRFVVQDLNYLHNRRIAVPVINFPIATDHLAFAKFKTLVSATHRRNSSSTGSFWSLVHSKLGSDYKPDYAFTGSYFNAYRRIMDFQPERISKWNGVIVGEDWDKASVSKGWKRIAIGRIPYKNIPEVYTSGIKIVIDDSNHVTRPWGSVNSRVFDALASGLLVISNGVSGIQSIFTKDLMAPFTPPVFETGEELEKLIDHYLSRDDERNAMINKMHQIVIKYHTYDIRSKELVSLVKEISSLTIMEKTKIVAQANNASSFPITKTPHKSSLVRHKDKENIKRHSSICVGIRMIESQQELLDLLVRALIGQFLSSPVSEKFNFKIFLINTEATTPEFDDYLHSFIDQVNSHYYRRILFLLSYHINDANGNGRNGNGNDRDERQKIRKFDSSNRSLLKQGDDFNQVEPKSFNNTTPPTRYSAKMLSSLERVVLEDEKYLKFHRKYHNPFYGYDSTEFLLTHMLNEYITTQVDHNSHHSHHHPPGASSSTMSTSQCEWILVTNGDNMYNSAWFDSLIPYLVQPKLDIIGWDFISHHARGEESMTNQLIRIELKRKFVDLGSIIAKSSLYLKANDAEFLPSSLFTNDLFGRDFLLLSRLLEQIPTISNETVCLIHKCLMFHQ
eukprot:gene4819-6754_t